MSASGKAFSLIELLAVLLIVAALLALLLPALGTARRRAKTVQCAAQLRSIGQVIQLYRDDHDGRYPWAYGAYMIDNPANTKPPLPTALAPYLAVDDPTYHCPADVDQVFDREVASGHPGISYSYFGYGVYLGVAEHELGVRWLPLMRDALGTSTKTDSYDPDPFHVDVYNVLYPDNHVEQELLEKLP